MPLARVLRTNSHFPTWKAGKKEFFPAEHKLHALPEKEQGHFYEVILSNQFGIQNPVKHKCSPTPTESVQLLE